DLETDTEMPERHVLPTPHDAMLASTHLGGPCMALTARKSIRPLPSHRLELRTLRYSEAYCRWRSVPLSTMYPPTTSESLAGDSSSESSTGPSRKRCRSPTAIVPSSIPSSGALVPSRADILLHSKRFRDFISQEDSIEEDIDADVLADIEADSAAIEVATDMDVEVGVDAGIGIEVDVGIDIENEVESNDIL
nr:hypothetical protein [Tanacetum cinerariifolium]